MEFLKLTIFVCLFLKVLQLTTYFYEIEILQQTKRYLILSLVDLKILCQIMTVFKEEIQLHSMYQ